MFAQVIGWEPGYEDGMIGYQGGRDIISISLTYQSFWRNSKFRVLTKLNASSFLTSAYALHFLSKLGLSTYRKLDLVNIAKSNSCFDFSLWRCGGEKRRRKGRKFFEKEKVEHTEKKKTEKKNIWWKKNDNVNEPTTAWIYSNLPYICNLQFAQGQMFEEKKYPRVSQEQPTPAPTGSLKMILTFYSKKANQD